MSILWGFLKLVFLCVECSQIEYKFGRNYGKSFYDYSGNFLHAVNGESSTTITYDTIPTDRGAYFSGSSIILLPSNNVCATSFTLVSPFSILFWLYNTPTGFTLFTRSSSNTNYFFSIIRTSNKKMQGIFKVSGSTSSDIGSGNSFGESLWSLITLVVNGNQVKYYENTSVSLALTLGSSYSEAGTYTTRIGDTSSGPVMYLWYFVIMNSAISPSTYVSTATSSTCFTSGGCSCGSGCAKFYDPDLGLGSVGIQISATKDSSGNTCSSSTYGCTSLISLDCQCTSTYSCVITATSSCQCISLTNGLTITGACSCTSGYNGSGGMCCGLQCNTCSVADPSVCTACVANNAVPDATGCKCSDRFFGTAPLVTTNACTACNSECATCVSLGPCLTCVATYAIKVTGGNGCTCMVGYFGTAPLSTSTSCAACYSECASCNSYGPCSTCVAAHATAVSGGNGCKCDDGYYGSALLSSSTSCSVCFSECASCSSYGPCLTCIAAHASIVNGGNGCECDSGYFGTVTLSLTNSCSQCYSECATCSSYGPCISCIANHATQVVGGNGCTCNPGYYGTAPLSSPSSCSACFVGCATCSSYGPCLSCVAAFATIVIGGNGCVCSSGYFGSTPLSAAGSCSPCHTECATCDSYGPCLSCIASHASVVVGGNGCTCDAGYSGVPPLNSMSSCSSSCHPECASCVSYGPCLTCVATFAAAISGVDGCSCNGGYYGTAPLTSAGSCMACYSECSTCDSYGPCLSCVAIHAFVISGVSGCSCDAGYYGTSPLSSAGSCSACHFECATCSTYGPCLSCVASHATPIGGGSGCSCDAGYYGTSPLNSAGSCNTCYSECATCSSSGQCLTCVASHATPIGGATACACDAGYYGTSPLSSTGSCSACHSECATCSSYGPCLSCIANYASANSGGNGCVCNIGYYGTSPLSSTGSCSLCDSECATCNSSGQCLTCVASHATPIGGGMGCACDAGYYGTSPLSSAGSCSACHSECATCSTYGPCLSCVASHATPIGGGSGCSCDAGYYGTSPLNFASSCNTCHPECATCSTYGPCLSCVANHATAISVGNGCTCDFGYSGSPPLNTVSSCLGCSSDCLVCNSLGECTTCLDMHASVLTGENQCTCNIGYYGTLPLNTINSCLPCNADCLTCNTTNACIECKDSNKVADASMGCTCKEGFYKDSNGLCQPCNIECKTCTSASSCVKCLSSNTIIGQSFCECVQGYYNISKSPTVCDQCASDCATCVNSSSCTSCKIKNSILTTNGTCICPQNSTIINDSCKCIEGLYFGSDFNLKSCIECENSCRSCSNATACDTCLDDFYISKNTSLCIKDCSSGFVFVNSSCHSCPLLCDICSKDLECLQCKNNSQFANETCSCDIGFTRIENECVPQFFSATLTVSIDNYLRIDFTRTPSSVLTLQEFYITLNASFGVTLYQKTQSTYLLFLNFTEDIKKGTKVTVEILHYPLYSTDGSQLDNYTLEGLLYDYSYILEELKIVAARTKAASQSAVSSSISMSIISNPAAAWALINTIQLIAYMPINANPLPPTVITFFTALGGYNVTPNLMSYIFSANTSSLPYSKAQTIGVDSSVFWINLGPTMLVLFLFLTIWPFIYVITKFKLGNIAIKCSKYLANYRYNIFLRFWIQAYLDIGFYSLIQIKSIVYEPIGGFINTASATIGIICVILTPPGLFVTSFISQSRLKDENDKVFHKKFESLFYEFKLDKGFLSSQYYTLYFFRRLAYLFSQVYLNNYHALQAGLNIAFTSIILGFLLYYRPYKEWHIFASVFIGELCMLVVLSLSCVFFFESSSEFFKDVENSIIFSVLGAMAVQLLVSIYSFGLAIKILFKRIEEYRARRFLKHIRQHSSN